MTRKYTGNSDGVSKKGARAGTEKFVDLCQRRWKFSNMGIFANRRMNNAQAAADPTNPKWLSVHATGRACDIGYKKRKDAVQAWNWFLEHAAALGIEEIHDYAFDPDGAGETLRPHGQFFAVVIGLGVEGLEIRPAPAFGRAVLVAVQRNRPELDGEIDHDSYGPAVVGAVKSQVMRANLAPFAEDREVETPAFGRADIG